MSFAYHVDLLVLRAQKFHEALACVSLTCAWSALDQETLARENSVLCFFYAELLPRRCGEAELVATRWFLRSASEPVVFARRLHSKHGTRALPGRKRTALIQSVRFAFKQVTSSVYVLIRQAGDIELGSLGCSVQDAVRL